MATPSEVVDKYVVSGEIDVPELGGTVSWADLERDASCWLGNTMQWAYYTSIKRLEPLIREAEDKDFLRIWRYLQISDHLYYMFTAGGGPGEVHSYFSPFSSPTDAFVTAQSVALDFENRVKLAILAANEPFLFYTDVGKDKFTGIMAWSMKGLIKALKKVNIKAIEFHSSRGDFEEWIEKSLNDKPLAERLKEIGTEKLRGENLRKALIKAVSERFDELKIQVQTATKRF